MNLRVAVLAAVVLTSACGKKKAAPRPVPVVRMPRPAQPKTVANPPSPEPRSLGAILPAGQKAELAKVHQRSAAAARRELARLQGKKLTREQAETASRIRSLLGQADEVQQRDPAMAAQLAGRAEVLARDLGAAVR
jgi:hypothetical protein